LSASLAVLFPSPILSAAMVYELAESSANISFVETMIILGWAACVAYVIFDSIRDYTWIPVDEGSLQYRNVRLFAYVYICVHMLKHE
jgi:hypothetical protein